MSGSETIKINGVTVRANEVQRTETRENGAIGVLFKTGVFALVQNVKQGPNATLTSASFNNKPTTLGYYLNGVTIEGSQKADNIFLTDSQGCHVNTNATGWTEEAKNDNIVFQYEKLPTGMNSVSTDSEDKLTVTSRTYPWSETKHTGQLNGMY